MSTPSIPPRPQRNTQAQPLVPPRPIRKTDPSPTRSPLNFPPTALANRPPPKRTSQELPRRPPSVSLPDLGHEGDEYSSFDQLPPEAHGVNVDKESEQTRNVAADLPMHQPKASVPQSTATKNISKVTDTDSTTAAGHGIGRSKPADDVHKQPPADASSARITRVTSNPKRAPSTDPPNILRTKASFSRSTPSLQLERQTSRPASLYGDDAEHGIPEIGQQIPLNRFAGDAQAPTPGGGQSAHTPGIGYFNDGSARHHKKRHSRQEFLTHDSYGLEHDENRADQFEKEWMKKHPQEAAKEHLYRHLPKPETAMSSEQLNQLIHGSDSGAAPMPSTPGEEDAIQEYLARMSPRVSQADIQKSAPDGDVAPAAPRKAFSKALHPNNAIDDDHHHHHYAPRKLSRYESEEEHTHRDGTPILAADELQKRPGSAFLPAAVVPEPRADDDFYYESGGEHGSRRSSMHVPSRPSSRPGSVHGAQAIHGYGGGSLHRFVSHEEAHHSGSGTPLEEIEEYEPLFPEDDERVEKPKAIKKRPDLAAMHHFPSQDVWEDTPSSLQYSAEVSTPDLERPQKELDADRAAGTGGSTFETPEQEQARKYAGADMTSKEKTFITPHYKPGVLEEVKASHRPSAHRFPSSDVWEDTPSSMLGVTTVSTPEMDDVRSPPEDRATTSAIPGSQDDMSARATTAGGLSIGKPSIPSRPQRSSKLSSEAKADDEETSPTKTKAPSIPAKPSLPARPVRPARGEGAPLEQSRSGESDEGARSPKSKPSVPARPGSKISAMQGNFLSDLNNRLKLGPQAPPKKEEPQVSEEADREPLADARKSRAKGPPRRKPAASPVADRKQATTFAMSPLITCWTIDETDELQVQNESEKEKEKEDKVQNESEEKENKDPESAHDAPKAEKILEENGQNNTDAAAPAEASDVASEISKSSDPSETAQGHAASADTLKAALAEAGAGPAVAAAAVEEESEAVSPAETAQTALSETVEADEKVTTTHVPGSFPREEADVVVTVKKEEEAKELSSTS